MELKALVKSFVIYSKTDQLSTKEFREKEYKGYKLKVCFGHGIVANTTWIAFLKDNNKPRKGIYPLLQYHKKLELITIIFGESEYIPPDKSWKGIDSFRSIGEYFKQNNLGKVKYSNCKLYKAYNLDGIEWTNLVQDIDSILLLHMKQGIS
ncbi:MAG TPA: hypothetical protein VGN63_23050 [Flavisolibacter sp.]|jgi:hypothetical protein|nr:hypothetical protein [Flavisolibacter sp.]